MTVQAAAETSTPTFRATLRHARFWLGCAAIAILIVVIVMLVEGVAQNSADTVLSATSAAPDGSRALVRVLEEHGVQVTPASSRTQAHDALASHPGATLLLYDPAGYLAAPKARALSRQAAATVLVAPPKPLLAALAPTVRAAGRTSRLAPVSAGQACALFAPGTVQAIAVDGTAYQAHGAAARCFRSPAGGYAVVRGGDPGTLTTVGSTELFENGGITRTDNAAAAIGLLGSERALVWYLPSLADTPRAAAPTLAELTPGWVTPVAVLLIATALAAIAWRGRRFGPLVAETLPVTVRARETMEGRARLYQRANARAQALQNLRVGAIDRLATRLRLPPEAEAIDVADAVAGVLNADRQTVRNILVDETPARDADLMRLSDALAALESQVTHSLRPAPTHRTARDDAHDDPGGPA
jgi:hypothetical protein